MKNFVIFLSLALLQLVGAYCQSPCNYSYEMYGAPNYYTQVLNNGAVRVNSSGILGYVDWGDSTKSNTKSIDGESYHIYNLNGTYHISFTYGIDFMNCTIDVDTAITITDAINDPCAITFTKRYYGFDQWMVTPYVSNYPMMGSNLHWDFGNGQSYDSLDRQVQSYPLEGNYNVCVTQTNPLVGCSNTYCDTLEVNYHTGHNCEVNLDVVQQNNFVKIGFAAEDSVYNLLLENIDYGDGVPSDGQFTHRYTDTGSYVIVLEFNNSQTPWNCDTLVTYTVFVDSIVGPPCNAGIHVFEYTPIGTYNWSNPQTLYYGATYQQWWNFGGGWINNGNNSSILMDFPSVGTYNVCNALYVAETGCADTVCGNFYIEHSAVGQPCDIFADYSLIYKDAFTSLVSIRTTTTPFYSVPYVVQIPSASPADFNGTYSGYYNQLIELDSNMAYNAHAYINGYGCFDTYDFIIDVTNDSVITCDSLILDVNVVDHGNGNFELKPVFHNNIGTNFSLISVEYNINGYKFTSNLSSVFIQLPISGEFSGWAEFTAPYPIVCSPAPKYYFTIDNTASSTPSLCDAYFTLEEDTNALQPNTWVCYNGSNGSNLSYLWDFGDGGSSTDQLPTYTYAAPGYYEISLTITDTVSGCTDTYFSDARSSSELIQYIIPGGNLGLEQEIPSRIFVYPNPSSDRINILVNNSLCEGASLMDPTGRVVKTLVNPGSIDIADLANGIYYLQIRHKNKSYASKIIKI